MLGLNVFFFECFCLESFDRRKTISNFVASTNRHKMLLKLNVGED